MYRLTILFLFVITCTTPVAAETIVPQRTDIIYVVGMVLNAADGAVDVDLGEVQFIDAEQDVAVFRPVGDHFEALGRLKVEQVGSTSCICTGKTEAQRGDLVIVVRELYELKTSAKHRGDVIRREVIRARTRQSQSSFRNISLANDLSSYAKQYPSWVRGGSQRDRRLLSSSFHGEASRQLDNLQTQLDLMRLQYRRSTVTVAAAGDKWASVMAVLAGPTATAGHELLQLPPEEGAEEPDADAIQLSAIEVRSRVQRKMFEYPSEQQNVIAMIIAILAQEPRPNIPSLLSALFPQTQFPKLAENDQLALDIQTVLVALQ